MPSRHRRWKIAKRELVFGGHVKHELPNSCPPILKEFVVQWRIRALDVQCQLTRLAQQANRSQVGGVEVGSLITKRWWIYGRANAELTRGTPTQGEFDLPIVELQ